MSENTHFVKYHFFYLVAIIALLLLTRCGEEKGKDLYHQPAITTQGTINAVIEIPAGTNLKIEHDSETGKFVADQQNGKDRIIDFLPYPANYGYIPSTMMAKAKGGDGDALDVLVLSQRLETGSLVEIQPIATLNLRDKEELDTKIIAIPVDTSLQIMQIKNFEDFLLRYNGAMRIIETWFLNYKGLGQTQLLDWKNEHAALMEIKKWSTEETLKD